MLNIRGNTAGRLCDGVSRRDLLRVGCLGMGGLSLPGLLQAESQAGIKRSHKAIIMVYMAGAPPHQDLWDPKPEAPSEYRGDLRSISTNVDGIRIGELLPGMAKIMDKCIAVRSVIGAPSGSHDSFMCYTGRKGSTFNNNGQPPGGWPSIGATLSRLMGSGNVQTPAFVGLAPKAGHPPYGASGKSGYLGVEHDPFKPAGQGMGDMVLNGITVRGSIVGTRLDLQESIDFAAHGKVRATVEVARLADINTVFDRMHRGQIEGRVVMDLTA